MIVVLNFDQLNEIYINKEKFQDWYYIFEKPEVEVQLYLADLELDDYIEKRLLDLSRLFNNGSDFKIFNNIIEVDNEPNYVLFEKVSGGNNKGYLLIDELTLENPFKLNYFKNLVKGKNSNSWKVLFYERNLVSNTLIINDPYILHAKKDHKDQRDKNILDLIDSILPTELDITYHILICTTIKTELINCEKHYEGIDYYEDFLPELIKKIENLRRYKILVEVTIGKAFHKRKLFTNFLNVTTDKGFKVFNKQETEILDQNDILIETIYSRNNPNYGDTQFDEMNERFKELNKYLRYLIKEINSENCNIKTNFYFSSFVQEGQIEIKNRLINTIL